MGLVPAYQPLDPAGERPVTPLLVCIGACLRVQAYRDRPPPLVRGKRRAPWAFFHDCTSTWS